MGDDSDFLASARHTLLVSAKLFGLENISLSFNGGKDSTVLLHLLLDVFPEDYRKVTFVYFQQENEFPEVLSFIEKCNEKYKLDLIIFKDGFKESLAKLQQNYPSVRAIILGTRHGDPYSSHLSTYIPTDNGWPLFMRIHPILHWTYADVWEFLRGKDYCHLYDKGYTSLGNTQDTVQNPLLYNPDSASYSPAHKLMQWDQERSGRKKYSKRASSMSSSSTTPTSSVTTTSLNAHSSLPSAPLTATPIRETADSKASSSSNHSLANQTGLVVADDG